MNLLNNNFGYSYMIDADHVALFNFDRQSGGFIWNYLYTSLVYRTNPFKNGFIK